MNFYGLNHVQIVTFPRMGAPGQASPAAISALPGVDSAPGAWSWPAIWLGEDLGNVSAMWGPQDS